MRNRLQTYNLVFAGNKTMLSGNTASAAKEISVCNTYCYSTITYLFIHVINIKTNYIVSYSTYSFLVCLSFNLLKYISMSAIFKSGE